MLVCLGNLGLEGESVIEELDKRLRLTKGLEPGVNQSENASLSNIRFNGSGPKDVSVQPKEIFPRWELVGCRQ